MSAIRLPRTKRINNFSYDPVRDKGDRFLDGGRTQGDLNEWRVDYGIRKSFSHEPWFIKTVCSRTNDNLDKLGIDLILETIWGSVSIQVKSGAHRVNAVSRKKYLSKGMVLLRINHKSSCETTRDKIVSTIKSAVKKLQSKSETLHNDNLRERSEQSCSA